MEIRNVFRRGFLPLAASLIVFGLLPNAHAQTLPAGCATETYADVVALDQPWAWNRFGALEPQGMMYALRRDVVPSTDADGLPDPGVKYTLTAGKVTLRRDKRPRPLVLRVNAGGCLRVRFTNLLSTPAKDDEQPETRAASMHFIGMEAVASITDMGSNVGGNPAGGIVAPGVTVEYKVYAPKEGTYVFYSTAAMTGGEGDSGSISSGLFGAVNVEPAGSVWYRSQVTRDDLDLARTDIHNSAVDSFPKINYEAVYPAGHRYAGLPILRMTVGTEIVHSDLTAIISGPAPSYALTNPAVTGAGTTKTYPNRTQPFREFSIIFHDEVGAVQAFPEFETDQLNFTLHSVRDAFAINYGTGGAGAEIIANRVGVGPARDCVECKYEEFFLSSWALGDPSMVVDTPANAPCSRTQIEAGDTSCYTKNVAKATRAFYPDDPSNVYHSYLSDHVKFRNSHAGSDDHHVFHLHAHQWLHSPNSDKSSYRDSQAIGQGAGFTYEIAYDGSGNRNKTVGDSIFHCHFYPHFAQGMWSLWRVHDVLELGTRLDANGRPAAGSRAYPDNEIPQGTPIPALVPIPVLAMAPVPGAVQVVNGQVVLPNPVTANPGYPFFIPGKAGRRPPHPPMDFATDAGVPLDGGLPRHVVVSGAAVSHQTRFDFDKTITSAKVQWLSEAGEPVEQVAMNFHATPGGVINTVTPLGTAAGFKVNGHPAKPGAPFADPCFNEAGAAVTDMRYYKAADIQLDVKFNKAGWHFPQQRMIALWQDVDDLLAPGTGGKPPEPFFFRANSGQCIEFWYANLVPNKYTVDDFQVRTPTDVLGQHIHLVKFDVLASDGGGNGWNYEDGSFGGEEVQERIKAIRTNNGCDLTGASAALTADRTKCPVAKPHPFFTGTRNADCDEHDEFLGAQTTVQRWWADPITNLDGGKRTLRTVFTHDHFGPSTHQQAGLYAGLIVEPTGSTWFNNETGIQLSTNGGPSLNQDGGPTSWQAVIHSNNSAENYREFMIEFADFQPMYEPGGPSCPDTKNTEVGWIDVARAINPPAKEEVGLNALYEKAQFCPGADGEPNFSLPAPCPEAVSAADIGAVVVNYRNEPLGLRVNVPGTSLQAAGKKGDLSFAYQSRTDRANPALNIQPNFYQPLTAGLYPGDPYTPLLRAFEGDKIMVRTLVGAHEEPHNFTVHALKWLFEPDDPNSGYRNSQMMGISEWFDLEIPRVPSLIEDRSADFLYEPSASVESQWVGAWGILRVYRNGGSFSPAVSRFSLMPLATYNPLGRSSTPDTAFERITVEQARAEGVPGADVDAAWAEPADAERTTAVTGTSASSSFGDSSSADAVTTSTASTASPAPLGPAPGGVISVACPSNPVYVPYDVSAVSAKEVLQNDLSGVPGLVYNSQPGFAGKLFDPTAIMFVYTSDLTFVGGRPRLNPNVRREPLILRARSGECLKVKLRNWLPTNYADAPGYSGVNMIIEGFNQNEVRPSMEVSLHPQLVFFDVQRSDGSNVGLNPSQVTKQTVEPGNAITYYWYAGDVRGTTSTPIEFGATGLTSADPIKHSNKGLMGSLIIEPPTAQWALDLDQAGKTTRASAVISSPNGSFRSFHEFALIFQDDVNLQYAGGKPVPNLVIDDDAENSGQKAVNYRTEPLWNRVPRAPETPLEVTGDFTSYDQLLHNSWVGGDPETPVFEAHAGEAIRFRVVHPAGHTQAHVFELYGHPWLELPYISNSTRIGSNPNTEWIGTRGGHGPTDHFDAFFPDNAGGKFGIRGDYFYRSYSGPRLDAGMWGLLRVIP